MRKSLLDYKRERDLELSEMMEKYPLPEPKPKSGGGLKKRSVLGLTPKPVFSSKLEEIQYYRDQKRPKQHRVSSDRAPWPPYMIIYKVICRQYMINNKIAHLAPARQKRLMDCAEALSELWKEIPPEFSRTTSPCTYNPKMFAIDALAILKGKNIDFGLDTLRQGWVLDILKRYLIKQGLIINEESDNDFSEVEDIINNFY